MKHLSLSILAVALPLACSSSSSPNQGGAADAAAAASRTDAALSSPEAGVNNGGTAGSTATQPDASAALDAAAGAASMRDASSPANTDASTDGGLAADAEPAPTCSDGLMNGDELGLDCGGSCEAACFGLDVRASNTTCLAGAPPATGDLTLKPVWINIGFQQPVKLVQGPASVNDRFYIVELQGRIVSIGADPDASDIEVELDVTDSTETGAEAGMWSMAFDPDYAQNGYIYTTRLVDSDGLKVRLARFTRQPAGGFDDELVLVELEKDELIHHGGDLAFGPDGYLYMSLGDDKRGGGSPDEMYGTIIRVTIEPGEDGDHAVVPEGNPFDNFVWAYGFRNPWRFSFDRQTGDLWVGDVGECTWEEINLVVAGGNYGWTGNGQEGPGGDDEQPVEGASYENDCGDAWSVTGGYVYRGSAIPDLVGQYIYGDFEKGRVWKFDPESGIRTQLFDQPKGLAAWGEDNSGELYYVDLGGWISKLQLGSGDGGSSPALQLSQTGCFSSVGNPLVPASGVIPYQPTQSFWSDGAEKYRHLAIPDGTELTIGADGDWELPNGGVLIKSFAWQEQLFETRFLVRHTDGSYSGYTYKWNEEQTDATLVLPEGEDRQLPGLLWTYPARSACFECHTPQAGTSLSLETRQLNIDAEYPVTGRTANQLQTLAHLGMVTGNLEPLEPYPAIDDTEVDIETRAKGYLHVNCASCHRGTGASRATWSAVFDDSFSDSNLCNALPIETVTEYPLDERLLVPGHAEYSTLWARMHQREDRTMPPLGSRLPDSDGADFLEQWINDMTSCPPGSEPDGGTPLDAGADAQP